MIARSADVTRSRAIAAPVVVALALLAGASLARAEGAFSPTRVGGDAGSATAIAHWQIQSSAKAQQSGAEVSSAGFSTREGWYPVSGRATVMAGLMENGTYKNVFYGDNLRAVEEPDSSGNVFVIPWWYRTEFTVAEGAAGHAHAAAYQRHDRERRCLVERATSSPNRPPSPVPIPCMSST